MPEQGEDGEAAAEDTAGDFGVAVVCVSPTITAFGDAASRSLEGKGMGDLPPERGLYFYEGVIFGVDQFELVD